MKEFLKYSDLQKIVLNDCIKQPFDQAIYFKLVEHFHFLQEHFQIDIFFSL